MSCAGFSNNSAGTPEVTVQDKHRSGDRPAEEDFAVSADAFVRKNTVGTFLDPVDNVLAAARPEEAHANTKECFVDSEMAANRAAMEDVKNKATQGGRYNDEQE
jgi:hypothetical protein